MSANPYASKLSEYAQVSAHARVAAADPHKLILMLMDGALERIAAARGCMARNDVGGKAQLLNRVIQIIGELRGSLDLSKGAQIAANLDGLYDYMTRRVLQASLKNSVEMLDEVAKLLRNVRDAWAQVPVEASK
ncbi:MAG TPA: flagellar export chaperone FliS [Lacipirellulaceae bacterium]